MKQKIALITGASRGIGRDVAETLAKNGYLVILTARNKDQLIEVCSHINMNIGQAVYYKLDVTNRSQVKTTIEAIIAKYGSIDVLFNNAGISIVGTTEIDDDDIEVVLKTNLGSAIFIAKYVALQMKQQQSGYIINLSSLAGTVGMASHGIYSASKFGILGFSESLAMEMAMFGVKVTAICPGLIATDMTKEFNFERELMIQPADISKTIEYLLNLSQNTIPTQIVLNCMAVIARVGSDQMRVFNPS